MKRRFLIRTLIISLSAMLVFGASAVLLIHYRTESMLKDDLLRLSDIIKDEAMRKNSSLLQIASFNSSSDTAFRITFIDSAGNVVADSIGGDDFDAHLDRPEVKSALDGNPMFSKRFSTTTSTMMIYYARSFTLADDDDMYVLRVAIESSAAWKSTLSALPILLLVTMLLALALIFLNSKYNNASLQPILELKHQLHNINLGQFERIDITKSNADLLPIINELNDIARHIGDLNKVRSEFFANASHELNTPLTYIMGYAELMEQGMVTDADKIVECGGKIRERAKRMDGLIADMLKLSVLENSVEDLVKERVCLPEILSGTIDTLKPLSRAQEVTINSICCVDYFNSNERLLKDILSNLIQNAIKYNKKGGSVDITIRQAQKNVEIVVADSGIGIADENLSRVFERFFRVDKSRSQEGGGTGLGLAIVKHSAGRLGGTVSLSSTLNRGSTFTVTLPK